MAKTITLTYASKQYTLEYNRTAATMIENQGFDTDLLGSKPVTQMMLLFYGAFAKNHASVKRAKMDEIFDNLSKRGELFKQLMEMYGETANVLSDGDEGDEGNAGWETNE